MCMTYIYVGTCIVEIFGLRSSWCTYVYVGIWDAGQTERPVTSGKNIFW